MPSEINTDLVQVSQSFLPICTVTSYDKIWYTDRQRDKQTDTNTLLVYIHLTHKKLGTSISPEQLQPIILSL